MLDKNQPYNKLSGKLVTPHIKWANPYCKGKLKALFIAPTLGQRETIELAQRLSLDYTALMTHDYHEMYQDPKWLPHAVPFPSVDKIVQKKLRKNYDLILIGKVSWKALPEYLREWISEQVEQGTGLVYVCPSSNEEIGSLFSGEESSDNESFVTDCAPLEVLPVLRELDKKSIFRLNLHGKGRVVK